MRKKSILEIVFFVIVLINILPAQTPVFHHLSFRDGLPSNTVLSLYQDHIGFMWFGTDKGLCRFDGNNFVTFAPDRYKNNFSVSVIFQAPDDEHYLWVGTPRRLFRYDIYHDIFYQIKLSNFRRIQKINDMCGDSTNNIWIAAQNGLFHIKNPDADSSSFYPLPPHPGTNHPEPTCLLMDSQKNIWAAAGMNLYRFDKNHFRFVISLPKKSTFSAAEITDIQQDQQGLLWLTTYGEGLYGYEPSTAKLSHYHVPRTIPMQGRINFQKSILLDHFGSLWIATFGCGLVRFNRNNHKFSFFNKSSDNPFSISDNYVTRLYEDRQGLIWVGTLDNGVDRFNRSITSIHNFSLPNKKGVTAFCEDHKQRIWIGGLSNQLFRFNYKHKSYETFELQTLPKQTRISGLVEDPSGGFLWIATLANGIYQFDFQTHRLRSANIIHDLGVLISDRRIFSLYKDRQGYIWLGSIGKNVLRINSQAEQIKKYVLKHRVAACFLEDKQGNFWIGHKDGISLLDTKSGLFKVFLLPKKNKKNTTVYHMCQSSDGLIWLGTSNGLFSFAYSPNRIFHFRQYNAFAGMYIKALFTDNQQTLWLSTKKGIINFDPTLNFIRNYGHEENVRDLGFNWHSGLVSHDGKIYFGNNSGFVTFRPLSGKELTAPTVYFTNFQYASTDQLVLSSLTARIPVSQPDTIKLDWAHYTFFIEFALDDYLMPRRNHFTYQLQGLSNDWHDLGNRHILNFINLPPHTYTLHIKGANSAGIWNKNASSLTFIIAAPFWQKWWFRISAALFFIALIWLLFLLRTYSIRQRNKELEELNKKLNKQIVFREQMEKMLRESEKKYRTLVEGIGEGIFMINKKGIFSFLNKTAAKRLGGEPIDFVGKSLMQIIGKQEARYYLRETADVINKGKPRLINTSIKLDGRLRHFRISLQPVANLDGKIEQVLSIAIETTEQVTLEEQLRQAQKMEAIGKLAGGIAHDFNNLLSIIRGYTYLLLQECPQNDPSLESLQEIEKASERAQSLTGQLLAFSRKQILKPKVMDLNHHIREMQKMLQRLIGEQIHLSTKLADKLPAIFADAGQIEQILMNLVVNARDAMPDGGKLFIQTERLLSAQKPAFIPENKNQSDFVVLTVRDTGIGMNEAVRQKLFDPFFTTKPRGQGTGLGLATVFGIVKQTDGYILVNSSPGKGAEFKIYFPAIKNMPEKEGKKGTSRPTLSGNEHILLVEDEEGLQVMIGKMLRLYGYTVTVSGSGTEGIELFSANPQKYDMIITDVVMPDMSGIEMVSRLNKQFGTIAVLYMSGYTDDEVLRHGIVENAINFIQKPFTPQKLTNKIRQILDAVK